MGSSGITTNDGINGRRGKYKLSFRKYFQMVRFIRQWKNLPMKEAEAPSLGRFETRLGKVLKAGNNPALIGGQSEDMN